MNIKILIKNKLELHNIYGFHRKFTINYQLDTERNIHVLSNNALTGGLGWLPAGILKSAPRSYVMSHPAVIFKLWKNSFP